jgi:hypothetical protein
MDETLNINSSSINMTIRLGLKQKFLFSRKLTKIAETFAKVFAKMQNLLFSPHTLFSDNIFVNYFI